MSTLAEKRNEEKMLRLRQVAEVYNAAAASGSTRPATAVAEAFGLKAVTARSLVFRARQEGLIGAYVPRPPKWRTEYAWCKDGTPDDGVPVVGPLDRLRSLAESAGGAVYVREVTDWRPEVPDA